jgi:ELWxxDGT repeat protein
MVKDINPGSASGIPPSLTAVGGRLLFSAADNIRILFGATDGTNGTELWVSDGTAAGTVMVADINPGAGNSGPANFTRIGGLVFFSANNGTIGIELWAVPLGAFGGALAEPVGIGCPGTGNLIPASTGVGLPVLGNAAFGIGVTQALANSVGILMLDAPANPIPLPGGCTLYTPRLLLIFATTTDQSGTGSTTLGIPNDLSLLGGQLISQWTVLDPGGAYQSQLSFSNGLLTVIGN